MTEETQGKPPSTGTETQVPTGTQTAPQIDPEQYAQLVAYYQQTAPLVEKIRPHYDNVVRYVDDENYRSLADLAYKNFEQNNKEREEEVPKWAQDIRENVKQQSEYVTELRNRDAIAASASRIRSIPNYEALEADDYALYKELQTEAKEVGITTLDGFENYVRKVLPRLHVKTAETATPERKTPPRSLQSDRALPGVPAPSRPDFSKEKNPIAARKSYIREQIRKAAGA